MIGDLVSNSQGAFVKDKEISNGILIANELVDGRRRSKEQGLVCKIDLEKAYDKVDWGFL